MTPINRHLFLRRAGVAYLVLTRVVALLAAVAVLAVAMMMLMDLADKPVSQGTRIETISQQVLSESLQTSYRAGISEGRRQMADSVASAYSQGQSDAMEAVDGKAEGIAFAQACLAVRGSR
jgi:hypothetical protein